MAVGMLFTGSAMIWLVSRKKARRPAEDKKSPFEIASYKLAKLCEARVRPDTWLGCKPRQWVEQ
jgi:hypothetical protein